MNLSTCVDVPAGSGLAIVTLLIEHADDSSFHPAFLDYVESAATLGMSLRRHAPANWARHVMLSGPGAPRAHTLSRLVQSGWSPCTVPTLLPPLRPRSRRWFYTFTKLHVFSLVQFRRVLSLDSDVVAVAPLPNALLNALDTSKFEVAAAQVRCVWRMTAEVTHLLQP